MKRRVSLARCACAILGIFFVVSCASAKISPTPVVTPTATLTFASPSPTPEFPNCALNPLPNETPIVRPTLTPTAPQTPARSGAGTLVDTTFQSALLNRVEPILVYLPPGYATSNQRYPTLYMLGGFAGNYREWYYYRICDVLERLSRAGKIQPMIVVMPDGGSAYWFNHAQVPDSDGLPWGDYIWQDVVTFADQTFRTLPERASRAIGGLSAGGQGALMLGLTHPEVFSIVGAHSPSLRGADGSLAFFGSREYFKQYDPQWLIENTQTWRQLTIWIDVGHEDTQWGGVIVPFHQWLDTLGVPHQFTDAWHGVHEDSYWREHLADYLVWYSSKLAGASTH